MASEQNFGAKIDRDSITLGGPQDEQLEFLQSLVTNDVAQATGDNLIYAALLTPQGRRSTAQRLARPARPRTWLAGLFGPRNSPR